MALHRLTLRIPPLAVEFGFDESALSFSVGLDGDPQFLTQLY
jgi:hypothetical protein